jgi:hypothetical protein
VVRTRFQVTVKSGVSDEPCIGRSYGVETVYLGMRAAPSFVPALCDNPVIVNKYGTYHWIGRYRSRTSPGEFEASFHPYFIVAGSHKGY